jgi:hypothetical protein
MAAQTFKQSCLDGLAKSLQICNAVLHHAAMLEIIARVGRRDGAGIHQEHQ